MPFRSTRSFRAPVWAGATLMLSVWLGALFQAQAPTPQPPAPAATQPPATAPPPPAQPPRQASPAAVPPPKTAVEQTFPPAMVQAGTPLFASQCGFCHGRDAMGGETGPDLTRSTLVAEDIKGDKITPIIRTGRIDKGMPPFPQLSADDMMALVAFIHTQKASAESSVGGRRSVEESDLQTGDATAGRAWFEGTGGCTACHSATGDLAGVASRYRGLTLLQRMLYPGGRPREGTVAYQPTVTVTLPDGGTVSGTLTYRDEFTIALTDAAGWPRSWPTRGVKYAVEDKRDGHVAALGKYSDADMHNVLAYLQTLR